MSASEGKGRTFTVDRVEGVQHVEITLRPGVNELLGPNAAGKTSTIRAITRAAGDSSVRLRVRDGARRGLVKGGGVVLTVGRVTRTTGEPAVEIGDYGALADLIDPGIKGAKERSRARIAAVLRLADVGVGPEDLSKIAGGDEGILETLEGAEFEDLLTLAETVRTTANAIAKDLEGRADTVAGKAEGYRERLEELPRPEVEPTGTREELEDRAREARRDLDRKRGGFEARVELEDRQDEIRGSLGERPKVEELEAAKDAAIAEVDRLEAELEEATRTMGRAIREHTEAERDAELYDERKAILDRPLEGPTEEDVSAAVAIVEAAEEAIDAARYRDERASAERNAQAAEEEAGDLRDVAGELRETAQSVPRRVGEVLAEKGLPGLTVAEDELAVIHDDGTIEAFDRLSLGQKTRVAADVLAAGESGKVVPLDPALWHSLDPPAKAEVAEIFAEAGLEVLTETATDGDGITVAHTGGDTDKGE